MKRTFEAGLWDKPDAQTIPDNAVSVARDVEFDGISLKKRTDPDSFSFANYTPERFTIWYPSTMPTSASEDYIIVFYTNLRLYYSYKTASGWSTSQITISGVTYTTESVLNFSPIKDSLIIVDGINKPHFIRIDKESTVTSGIRGYPAPKSKVIIEGMTEYDGNKFQEINTEPYFSDLGVFEVTYVYKDIFGNYSNPAPISKLMGDYQLFKIIDLELDEYEDVLLNEGADDRFLRKLVFSGAQLPDDLSSGLYDDIEEFVFYCRVRRFSDDSEAGQFRECLKAKIISKDPDADSNNYSVSSQISDLAPTTSYDNDVPPIAGLVESVGATTAYADVSEELPFPFTFKYYQKIDINNPNSNTNSGGYVKLRLLESEIANFIVGDFYSGAGNLSHTEHLRFYDTDITTPLQVIVYGHSVTNGTMDVMVYIPQLIGSSVDEIYFCFNPATYQISGYGVSDKYNIATTFGYLHGRFCVPSTSWTFQQVIHPTLCKSDNNIICSPMNESWAESDEVPNRHNVNSNGSLSGSWYGSSSAFIPAIGSNADGYGTNAIRFENNTTSRANYGDLYSDNTDEVSTAYGFSRFFKSLLTEYESGTPSVDGIRYQNVICGNYGKASGDTELRGWAFGIKYENTNVIPCIWYQASAEKFKEIPFGTVTVDNDINIFYLVSVDFENGKAYLYIYDRLNGLLVDEESIDIEDYENYDPSTEQNINLGYGGTAQLYNSGTWAYHFVGIKYNIYSQFDFLKDTYINDPKIAEALNNFQPYFDTEYIGWNGSSHDNVTFNDVEENTSTKNASKIVWTPENGINVPATNEKFLTEPVKGIIEAKSFLQQNYETSLLITSRNQLVRFVADDNGFSSNRNLIKEFTQYGQLSSNIVSMGESWYWGSEVGAIRWSPQGIRVISNGIVNGIEVQRVNLQILSTTKVIPIPVKQQVLFWDGTTGYLYHENGDRWTTVTDFDISDFDVFTQGDQTDNKTMLLTSAGLFKTYPGTNYTSQSPLITTKHYDLDNMKLRKIMANFDGNCGINTTVNNETGYKTSFNTDMTLMKWYGLVSGSWGYKYYHQITRFTKFNYLIEKFLKRG